MKVLITGAFGLLGSSLAPYLQICGHELIRHSRSSKGDVVADLTDWSAVRKALNATRPEVIVNLAALTNIDECERNPQKAYLINVRIVENLSKWIRQNDCKCYLIQISSDQVYDGQGPHKEGSVTVRNYYGFSKYAGELVAASVPSTILRTNFFGPSHCMGRRSISDWLVQSLLRGDPIRVFEDVRFSPLSLQRLVKLIEQVIVKHQPGLYNLGSKDGLSKADFAFTVAKSLNLNTECMERITLEKMQLLAHRPKDMRMDSSSFETVFGIELPSLNMEIQSLTLE